MVGGSEALHAGRTGKLPAPARAMDDARPQQGAVRPRSRPARVRRMAASREPRSDAREHFEPPTTPSAALVPRRSRSAPNASFWLPAGPPAGAPWHERRPHTPGGSDRPTRPRRPLQPRYRRPAVHQPPNGPVPPAQDLRQARHHLAQPARPRSTHPSQRGPQPARGGRTRLQATGPLCSSATATGARLLPRKVAQEELVIVGPSPTRIRPRPVHCFEFAGIPEAAGSARRSDRPRAATAPPICTSQASASMSTSAPTCPRRRPRGCPRRSDPRRRRRSPKSRASSRSGARYPRGS